MPQKQRKTLRKREYVKYVKFLRKQLRRRVEDVEVRSAKQWEGYLEHTSTFDTQEAVVMDTMQADAFWKNYATAQEWQNRHNITWWRSRCIALEQENEILRNKIRSLARRNRSSVSTKKTQGQYSHEMENDEDEETQEEAAANSSENLELNVTEDWLAFLEKSERHRREMQERRKSEENVTPKKKKGVKKEPVTVSTPETVQAKRKEAGLLYGDAAPKILAMEAALQVAANRYKDLTSPQYWPNIPLKP
ncbi:hypothetical protein DMN91_003012 [Ooceraea biroi]|uniref:Gem-associated protein n=1 Tax=Ooceraea biroi TaxID=2015173 RepID=A0A026WAS2_OOCBI|nr:uncharacterized protein F10E9.5 [Ooceraea biroi]EZA53078.1 Gem-associated protein [Ooceraea biroi]RLU24921.1 hypothetical protein DMN91_003012 [Ooceraea biroi]